MLKKMNACYSAHRLERIDIHSRAHDGLSAVGKLSEETHNRPGALRVKPRRWLIKEDEGWLGDQSQYEDEAIR